MKKLSFWAALNPWKARIIIIFSHILLLTLGWYTGSALNEMNIVLPGVLLLVFTLYYLASVFLYPKKEEKRKLGQHLFYIKQKICDFSLAASAWGMIICIANNKNVQLGYFNLVSASSIENTYAKEKPTAAEILASLKYRDKSTLTRTEKRILKKEFPVQLKNYAIAKIKGDKAAQDNTAVIILAIVLAIGLIALVASLSCSLSCNGNDGAALLVGILGTGAVVVGLIFFIRGLQRKQARQRETKPVEG